MIRPDTSNRFGYRFRFRFGEQPTQQWDSTDIEVKRVHQAFSVWRNQTGGGLGHRIPDKLWAQAVRLCERYNRSDVSDYLRLDRVASEDDARRHHRY